MSSLQALSAIKIKSETIRKALYKLTLLSKRTKLSLYWVRAHSGLVGNELADAAAKDGTTATTFLPTRKPFSLTKRLTNQYIESCHDSLWKRAVRVQSKSWIPKIDPLLSEKILTYGRFMIGLIIQAITGTNNLSRHTHNKDFNIPSNCRICNAKIEDFDHLVQGCPGLEMLSWKHLPGRNIDGSWSLDQLVAFLKTPAVTHLMTTRREFGSADRFEDHGVTY